MSAVHVAAGRIVAVKSRAARAAHPAVRLLRRQQFAAFPHRVLFGGPVAGITPPLKMRFGHCREEHLPGGIKIGARQVEGLGRAVPVFPDLGPRVEAEDSAPLIDVDRSAGADRDRADMDVAVIEVPAVRALGIAAASEGGHPRIEARSERLRTRFRTRSIPGSSTRCWGCRVSFQ
jgi:hypothetical protein